AEHGAFTVTLRTHEGNCPPISWQFDSDEETLTHFARMTRIFVHLKPYSLAVLDEYYSTGSPTIRHPILHYEEDRVLLKIKTEYLYGRDLLVAPVLKPKKTSWKVYLPEDEWIHVWTSRRYGKGWHVVPAPLGQIPVFYRASSTFADLFQGIKNL
ncbi:MAG TPA: alpha-glucosidase, partial [Candidatus Lokiarchaeia archaeon]|nr:alpha-glucosidase [Candidatus Lokiarchaeia archaeon]